MRKLVRGLYARFVPEAIQVKLAVYAKAIVGGSTSFLQLVNLTVPDYSDEAKAAVSAVLAVIAFLGIAKKRNRTPEDARVIVRQRRQAAGRLGR